MRVTIAGIGNAGSAIGADLALKGHEVTLLKTSNLPKTQHQEYLFANRKIEVIEGNYSKVAEFTGVTDDYGVAVKDADLIIVCTQTDQHERVIEEIGPLLASGQILLFIPGYLSTAYVLKHSQRIDFAVAEAASTPVNSRVLEPGVVRIAFRNFVTQIGVWPQQKAEQVLEVLGHTGYEWTLYASVVEAALHNPNLIVHTIGGFMSIPRVEMTDGEYWMYREVFTPRVWNLVESLDAEKKAVLEALDMPRTSYVESCKERNAPESLDGAKEVFFDWAHNHSQKGPAVPDSRYLTEDVPQGLTMLESMGEVLGIATPVCSSLITMAGIALDRDFRGANSRTVRSLGKENLELILGRKFSGSTMKEVVD